MRFMLLDSFLMVSDLGEIYKYIAVMQQNMMFPISLPLIVLIYLFLLQQNCFALYLLHYLVYTGLSPLLLVNSAIAF